MYVCRIILVSLLFFGDSAYECPPPASVAISVENSTAVFSGEVISEEYRDVKEGSMGEPREAKALFIRLRVKRWWKGNRDEEVDLYTSVRKYPDGTQSFMADDFRFRKGENYLVYAYGQGEKLRTNGCTRTKKLADAEKDLLELGEGIVPEKKGVALQLCRSLTSAWSGLAGKRPLFVVAWGSRWSAAVDCSPL